MWVRAKTAAGQDEPSRAVAARLEQKGGTGHDDDAAGQDNSF